MILKHEIPEGSKLYFGKKAKIKREIEQIASEVFDVFEYEEIITPYFSYHQLEALDEKEVIRFTDLKNQTLALRGDSSIDVIRLVLKRLKSEAKKWFYIQPVFRAPSTEIYQIGAEWLEGELIEVINLNLAILKRLNKNYPLVISNNKIPKIVCELTSLTLEDIEKMRIYKFKEDWLKDLINLNEINTKKYPKELHHPLEEMKKLVEKIDYSNIILSPLSVAHLKYYDGIFYKFINKNDLISKGGEYEVEGVRSVGFSIYTDNLIKDLDG